MQNEQEARLVTAMGRSFRYAPQHLITVQSHTANGVKVTKNNLSEQLAKGYELEVEH